MRQCVVCRRRQPASGLAQFKSFEPSGASTTRRTVYACIATACLQPMLAGVAQADVGDSRHEGLHELAEQRLFMVLGLARRCGELVQGVDRVAALRADSSELDSHTAPFCVAASDLSPRSRQRLPDVAVFADLPTLAHAIGSQTAGAAAIRPGRLAMKAAYWYRVWYETRSTRRRSATPEHEQTTQQIHQLATD